MTVRAVLLMLSLLLWTTMSDAQAEGDLTGQRVMVITPNAKLKQKEQTVGLADIGHIYTVEQVNGKWLWVPTRGGWIREQDVLPVDKALPHFTAEIEKNPKSAVAWRHRGRVHDSLGNFDEAVSDLTKSLQQQPTAAAYNDRGNVWFKRDELPKALADYSKAIQADPQFAVAYNNRSTVYSRQKKAELARSDVNAALRIDPKYAEAWNNRGTLHEEAGDYEKAIADFTEAIRLAPDYAVAFANRGDARKSQGEFAQAAADYRKAVELDPQAEFARNKLAWLLATCPDAATRDGAESLTHAKILIELAGDKNWNYLDTRAAAHAEAGEFDEAIDWAERAAKLAPDDEASDIKKRQKLYEAKKAYHAT